MLHPRRPVYVEIPTDLLSAQVAVPTPETHVPPTRGFLPDRDAFPRPFERPLVWAGGGATASGAGPLVAELCRRLGAPLLTSYGGRGLLPPDDPHLVPLPPHAKEAGDLWDAADLVVVVGSDLDGMNTQGFRQPRPPWVVTVDLEHPVNLEPDVHLAMDAVAGLTVLLEQAPQRNPWFTRPAGRELYAGPETAFLDALESGLTDDTVVVADMCVPGYWYGGFGRVPRPRGLAYPVGWGTLGFGFPAGIGAALSGRPAVALVGDGGFLFACGDLATVAQERVPLTTVLVDDGGYGMLAYDFTKDGDQPVGCDLDPPDFVALAKAFRIASREVTVAELGPAVAQGIASGQPSLLVLKASYTPPPNTSPRWYRAATS
jgi:acetolactate synthase-1/2/3 large subunit